MAQDRTRQRSNIIRGDMKAAVQQSAGFAAQVSRAIATTAEADRTAVAGVNLDEEAAKLLQFQQAYQASAKILQIAQSVFDTLMQSLAR